MAPKHHPTPLSGGDRKALNKEFGKARAMANILAAQSAEMRAKGEAMIQQADKLLCESWNERMWSDGEGNRAVVVCTTHAGTSSRRAIFNEDVRQVFELHAFSAQVAFCAARTRLQPRRQARPARRRRTQRRRSCSTSNQNKTAKASIPIAPSAAPTASSAAASCPRR